MEQDRHPSWYPLEAAAIGATRRIQFYPTWFPVQATMTGPGDRILAEKRRRIWK
jgi:hypothetical protein